ncbi:DUF494 family protein [Spiribacter pallidus]|jgi:Smg protein|uniref:Protein Smg homolog n=1 Tax=Spiribacter pallidus TaxID=1987936 RepID=A0ABV3TD72_9GAMM
MKENVFDILMYLFEHYFHDAVQVDPNRDDIEAELLGAGFTRSRVHDALNWIDALAEHRSMPELGHGPTALRVYTPAETMRLDADCQGFILYLEQIGILTPGNREVVIDRLMALDEGPIDLDTLKWVVLMVLFSQPGQEEACAWMENLLFESPNPVTH